MQVDTPSTPADGTEAQPTQDVEGFFGQYFEKVEGSPAPTKKKQAPPADTDEEVEDETEDPVDDPEVDTATDDEDSSDTAEDEAGDDDEAEDEEATDEEDEEQPELIPVKIDGKVEKVSLDELKKGYSRTKVFTQRTQEVAEQRKTMAAREQEIAAEREQLAKAIEAVNAQMTEADPEPDWDTLRDSDRDEYLFQKAVWAEKREKREKLERVKAEMERRNGETRQVQLAETLKAEQQALLDKVPAWKDEKKAEKDLSEIRQYAKDLGFPDDVLNNVYDHRLVLLLRDGARYKRLMANKDALPDKPGERTKIERGPKPLKPGRGARTKPAVREQREAAMSRLQKSGRTDDAAAVFKLIPGFTD